MELLEPHPDVVQHVVAHRVAAVAVVVDRGAPRRLVPIVEVPAELAEVVPLGAHVVVDDVQERRESLGMAGVDQPLQALRPAVAVLRRVREHPVVSPVPRPRELGDRHDLDGRDAQLAEVAQPGDDAVERPLGREGADVQLVEDQVLAADPLPAAVGPGEPIRPDDRRRPMDPLGLPERAGIRPLGPAVEPERIATALGDVRLLVAVIAAFLRLHRDLAPRRAVDQDQADPCAAGAQTRKRTDPFGDPTAPHRRAGPPCLISFIKTVLRLFRSRGLRPDEFPARFRLAADPMDGRLRPSRPRSTQRANACSPAGSGLSSRRVSPW